MNTIKRFGETWWGQAWLDALESSALVNPNRLPRGRTYARQDRVSEIEIEPGVLSATVEGGERYRAQLAVRRLGQQGWDTLLDRVVGKAKLSASLLSGEVPRELNDVLLPGAGDLTPDCNCPDVAEPCKHAAALCYVAADIFDADPFALLLLRGKGREELLGEIRRRRAEALGLSGDSVAASNLPRGADPGTPASAAYRSEPVPLGRSIIAPPLPRTLRPLAVAPPADSGIDEGELRELVADGARRAQAMLEAGGEGAGFWGSGLSLSVGADVARRAIAGDVVAIAETTRLPIEELAAAAKAFYHGGEAAIAAARQRWDADAEQLKPGVAALEAAGELAPKTRANTVNAGKVQLRLDAEGRWWRFEADDALGWLLASPPATDPNELL